MRVRNKPNWEEGGKKRRRKGGKFRVRNPNGGEGNPK